MITILWDVNPSLPSSAAAIQVGGLDQEESERGREGGLEWVSESFG